MSSSPARLYHFTCAHGQRRIGRCNCLIIPQAEHPLLGIRISWFTTEASPDRERTGLGQHHTSCDRMQFRYVITDLSCCRPWLESPARASAPGDVVDALERYGVPDQWWIASLAVPAQFDAAWALAGTP